MTSKVSNSKMSDEAGKSDDKPGTSFDPEVLDEDSVTMVEVLEDEKNLEEDAKAVLGEKGQSKIDSFFVRGQCQIVH